MCFILFSSCAPMSYRYVKSYSSNKFDRCTGLDTLININGYYRLLENNDTINMIFFNDGTYIERFDLENLLIEKDRNEKKHLLGYYGIYNIVSDTIKIELISKGSLNMMSSIRMVWYIIKDKETLEHIYSNGLYFTDNGSYNYKEFFPAKNSYAKFNLLNELPSNECRLKKDKFFWEDKKEWKEYMDSLKLKKKNKK
ncbi:MAG: hypothetical protein H6Q16_240 [Bacteroidetes bacterium]|nr:hypothetical protein [Bacteroidota bacterium]